MTRRGAAELALAANTVVWGATFVLVKAVLREVSPLVFLAARFSLASVLLAIWFRRALFDTRPKFRLREALAGGLAGAFLFSGYLFQTLGLRLTTAPKSAFITGLTSVLVPFLAALVYHIRPQISEVTGVLVATVGLGLMTLEGDIGSIGRGDLLTVLCTFAFAAHIVALGHFSATMRFEILSVSQLTSAAALSLSLFWWAETPVFHWQPVVVWGILITGILATALAFTIQAWAQRHTTSTRTALVYMLEPVVAWLTSFWIVGEGLSARAATGAILILGGVLLAEMKPLNPRAHLS